MKQHIWIVNSSILGLLFLLLGVQNFIRQPLPRPRQKKATAPELIAPQSQMTINLEKIYKNDLFGTYAPPRERKAVKKSLITPIPEMKVKSVSPPPEIKKPEPLPALKITVKGIILSQDPDKSMALIVDGTSKEGSFYVGSKIQDGQLIKITQNKVIILRSSGQQETHYLRKPEKLSATNKDWSFAIKKIDEKTYHIDPESFAKEIGSAGELVEALELGTVYQSGKPIGMRVGSVQDSRLGNHFGLKEGDMILTVNGTSVLSPDNRKHIHHDIVALQLGEQVIVSFERNGEKKQITYLLKKSVKPSPFNTPLEKPGSPDTEDEVFKLGPQAQQRQRRRAFEHRHRTAEQRERVHGEMRARMMENMRSRAPKRRTW